MTFLSILLLLLTLSTAQFTPAARQRLETDSHGGNGFTILPLLSEEKPSTVIVIHGLGGTGEEWGYLTLAMSVFSLNYVKFVIPTADTAPVTYLRRQLPSWFDINGLSASSGPAGSVGPDVNRRQLLLSVDRIDNIIKGEMEAGVERSRIFLVGFSQGGAVALTTFLRSSVKLAGCVGVATWVPLLSDYPSQLANRRNQSDILMVHGSEDDVVPIAFSRGTANVIASHGLSVNYIEIAGGEHIIISERIMNALEDFIRERAPGQTNFLTTLVDDLTENFGSFSTP